MVSDPIANWHQAVKEHNAEAVNELLDENVILYSPVVHTPQVGKLITAKYLSAALDVFGKDSFKYIREFRNDGEAVLEFEVELDNIYVNCVDMIKWNDSGKITEFKVLIRPLKAVNLIHQKMAEMLQRLGRPEK